MERPAKRQKLSQHPEQLLPTRTLDLTSFQRPPNPRRAVGKIVLPRVPDVTVTASIVEVAVNDGSTTTQIAAPTTEVAVSLDSLGSLILPGLSTASSSSSAKILSTSSTTVARSSAISSSAGSSTNSIQSAPIFPSNSTSNTATDGTVTVTATSTFHVTYSNGTFVTSTTAHDSTQSGSQSESQDTSYTTYTTDSSGNTVYYTTTGYVFGQGVTDTYSPDATATGAAYSNGNNGVAAGATATDPGPASASSSGGGGNDGSGGGSSGPVLTPQQTQMVGGIVGGVAGIALVLVVLLYILRRYRERLKQQGRLPEQLSSGHDRSLRDSGLIGSAAPMSQSSRSSFFPPAAVKKWRPGSDMTTLTNTTSTTGTDSERGFQRVSGRKIAPVLTSGGDQYGGSYGAFEKESNMPSTSFASRHGHDLSESSFYRDADGMYIGDGRPVPRSAPSTPVRPSIFSSESLRRPSLANIADRRDFANDDLNSAFYRNMARPKPDGVAVFRSSPARTPVTQSPKSNNIILPIQAPLTMDEDIPTLPSPGLGLGLGHSLAQQRMPSRMSTRTAGSGSGRFREDLA